MQKKCHRIRCICTDSMNVRLLLKTSSVHHKGTAFWLHHVLRLAPLLLPLYVWPHWVHLNSWPEGVSVLKYSATCWCILLIEQKKTFWPSMSHVRHQVLQQSRAQTSEAGHNFCYFKSKEQQRRPQWECYRGSKHRCLWQTTGHLNLVSQELDNSVKAAAMLFGLLHTL